MGAPANLALGNVFSKWPWQGDLNGLLTRAKRDAAMQSVVAGVLQPRPELHDLVTTQVREMAAFVFVYGVG